LEEEDEEGYTPDYEGTPVPDQTPYAGTSSLPQGDAASDGTTLQRYAEDTQKATERSPLLRRSTSRRRRPSVGPHGDATVTQAVLMVCLVS
jgi:solute carrier family 36 (proton-coupled amino acid transporter)